MTRKYLKIQIEEKNMLIDLSVLPNDKVKFSIGEVEGEEFTMKKEIKLDKLEELM